jgi:hypothetical protein
LDNSLQLHIGFSAGLQAGAVDPSSGSASEAACRQSAQVAVAWERETNNDWSIRMLSQDTSPAHLTTSRAVRGAARSAPCDDIKVNPAIT